MLPCEIPGRLSIISDPEADRSRKSLLLAVPIWKYAMASKQQLTDFLDSKVFDPILRASPDKYSDADRKKLKDVQDRTKSEKDRFHHYSSAQEVIDNYKNDLHSSTAKRVNSELQQLNLPTLPSVKDEFLKLAGD